MSGSSKLSVNGANSGTSSELHDQITIALLQNGGVGRIQSTLQQRLDESGWTENLRDYVTRMYRDGECTTFFDALEKVKKYLVIEAPESKSKGAVNGDTNAASLAIPRTAAEGGLEAVKKELERICEIKT